MERRRAEESEMKGKDSKKKGIKKKAKMELGGLRRRLLSPN